MKFYVTGRSSNFTRVEEAFVVIKELGHEVTFEWTSLPMVKPYAEHVSEAASFAQQGIAGVVEADVYIIFAHEDGNGVFTEFGAALAAYAIQGAPTIYAIGADKSHAMFNYHPAIRWRNDLKSVLREVIK